MGQGTSVSPWCFFGSFIPDLCRSFVPENFYDAARSAFGPAFETLGGLVDVTMARRQASYEASNAPQVAGLRSGGWRS